MRTLRYEKTQRWEVSDSSDDAFELMMQLTLKKALWMLAWAAVGLLQSCGENKAATECYHLQEALREDSHRSVGTVTKATETAQAQAEQKQAEAIAQVKLSDDELMLRRDEIVGLWQQQSELSLQAADIMTDDGLLSGRKSEEYKRVSQRRLEVSKQAYAAQNGLQIHCSLQ